jgi:hypothetical protein
MRAVGQFKSAALIVRPYLLDSAAAARFPASEAAEKNTESGV